MKYVTNFLEFDATLYIDLVQYHTTFVFADGEGSCSRFG